MSKKPKSSKSIAELYFTDEEMKSGKAGPGHKNWDKAKKAMSNWQKRDSDAVRARTSEKKSSKKKSAYNNDTSKKNFDPRKWAREQ